MITVHAVTTNSLYKTRI